MKYQVNEKGFYGNFGGAYIPEMLYPNIKELKDTYLDIISEPSFQREFDVYYKIIYNERKTITTKIIYQ